MCNQGTVQLHRRCPDDIDGEIVPHELRLGPPKELGPFVHKIAPREIVELRKAVELAEQEETKLLFDNTPWPVAPRSGDDKKNRTYIEHIRWSGRGIAGLG